MTRLYPQMSDHQIAYLDFVRRYPGVKTYTLCQQCKSNPRAGHRWVYAGVRRLIVRGLIRREPAADGRGYSLFAVN